MSEMFDKFKWLKTKMVSVILVEWFPIKKVGNEIMDRADSILRRLFFNYSEQLYKIGV